MSHTSTLQYHPGKPGREEGTRTITVKARPEIPATLTGPLDKIDRLLHQMMLWVYVEKVDDHWVAYCAHEDPVLLGPDNLEQARERAEFHASGETGPEARRALGLAVIEANMKLRRELTPPKGGSPS